MNQIFTKFWPGDYEVWCEPLSNDGLHYVLNACSHADCVGSVAVSESDDLDTVIIQRTWAKDRVIAAADIARWERVRVRGKKGREAA